MRTVESLIICTFMVKYRRVMRHNTKEWCKIWKGTDLYFKKWHKKFSEFWPNSPKCQNMHFNEFLLTKVCNVWAKKVKRSYASLYWRSKRKMNCGFINDIRNLLGFTGALKNLKIWTLRDFLVEGM